MIRRNVSGQTFLIGPLLAQSNGDAVVSGASIQVAADGGSFTGGAGTLTHVAGGVYRYAPTQGETDGAQVHAVLAASGAISVALTILTTQANPQDAVRFGLTAMPSANANAVGGLPVLDSNSRISSNVTAMAANVVTASSIASGAFTGAKFDSGAFDAVWSVGTRTLTSFGSLVADIWNHATRTLTSIADSAGVTTLLSRLTSGRATNLDNLDATVSSRLAASAYTAPPTAAAVADAVWDEGLSSHLTAGSAGAALNDAQTPQNVASEVLDALTADHAAAGTVGAAIGGIKAKTDQLTISGGLVDANIEAVNNVALQGDGSSSNKWRPV